MPGDTYFRPDPNDAAGRIYEEGLTDDAHKFASVHRFLAPGAISCERFLGLVGSKRDGELVFGFELILGWHGVGGDPENRGIGLGEFSAQS